MSKNTFKTWDDYTAEAAHAPFQLKVSAEETIEIPAPTGASLLQWARAQRTGDMEAMLIVLCGDQWPRIEKLLAGAPYKAMENLITDLALFFDLAEDVELIGPGGGKVHEKDPRKIRALIKQGYRPAGEAVSRT
ncbi:hypothetical protein AB0302_04470 [Micrococcus sp. NPDC078436]|uniref:hypothetical protein n=1 Tax=Micrococcus sp. NPDC078436 TaxID=3154960 RepID=UPI0034507BB8